MGGPAISLTREDLEALWYDTGLSQQQIVDRLGISRTSLSKLQQRWGLPRRPRPRVKNWQCDACRFRGWCDWAMRIDYRFPCMPEGGWGAGDRRRNGRNGEDHD